MIERHRWRCNALAVGIAVALASWPIRAEEPALAGTEADKGALVVLIGAAGEAPDLIAVLTELLAREGIAAEFVSDARFEPNAVLGERGGDPRVRVFIVPRDERSVRLYFRGPGGERFILRELALPNGLDEVGRELIAQVVETSTLALQRGAAGITREQARADLARETPKPPSDVGRPLAPAPSPAAPASRASARRVEAVLGARALGAYAGPDLGAAFGGGAEAGATLRFARGALVRIRLVGELWAPQSIDTARVAATVQRTALRGGIDGGLFEGAHAGVFGISAGADLTQIAPSAAHDAALALSEERTNASPALRIETRYELSLSRWSFTVAAFGDVPLVDTHYDVVESGRALRVAAPWPVQPGIALTIAWCPILSGS